MTIVYNDGDGLRDAVSGVANDNEHVPNPDGSGINPSVANATAEGNKETNATTDKTRKDGNSLGEASKDLDDIDKDNSRKAGDVDTKLSSDRGGDASPRGGGGSGAGSPMSSGGAPAGGGSPPPPSMPPMQSPQMGSPAGMTMPKDAFGKLLDNYNPAKAASAERDAAMSAAADPRGINKDAIDAKDVEMRKTGLGSLSKSQMGAVIDKALDLNGISRDPKVRSQWHELLMFQAKGESSYIADAVNLSDSNAHGARAADGHPFNCSRGIWQTIPTTFAAHHVSGTSGNIYDPTANGAAAVRYIMSRYHVDPDGGASLRNFYAARMRGGYTGY